MIIPAAGFIDAALDALPQADASVVHAELQELRTLGPRGRRLRLPPSLLDQPTAMERGYLLGLEVARILLRTMPAAITAGIEL